MKSEVIDVAQSAKERKYPWIGVSDMGNIVLFSKENLGVLIYTKSIIYNIGYQTNDWDMSCFKEFTGKVVLQN